MKKYQAKNILFYSISGLFLQRCQDWKVQQKTEELIHTEDSGAWWIHPCALYGGLDCGLSAHYWTMAKTPRRPLAQVRTVLL